MDGERGTVPGGPTGIDDRSAKTRQLEEALEKEKMQSRGDDAADRLANNGEPTLLPV